MGEAGRDYWHRVHQERPQVLAERQEIVDRVARKRRTFLNWARVDHSQLITLLGRGRLLAYNPDENAADGAAMNASGGFFDGDNVPPWDLWLVYTVERRQPPHTYLLAWVPPECLELATAGIEVNPEACIRWAEDVDAEFVRQLRGAGLLR